MNDAAAGLTAACRSLGVGSLAAPALAAGVTRVADLTGVDRLGVPVVQAVRPAGRSLSIAMGKGGDLAAAATGAIMEAVEHHCAESRHPDVAPCAARTMPPAAADFAAGLGLPPHIAVPWVDATDLASGEAMPVPFAAVTLDFTRNEDTGLRVNSNGLAAGRTQTDALLAATGELVERDRFARWLRGDPLARAGARLDPVTIEDAACTALIHRIGDAGCSLLAWDLTAAGGLPVVAAAIVEGGAGPPALPPTFGVAARFDPHAALRAAIEEAAQSRAGLIVGARDDLRLEHYAAPAAATARMLLETLAVLPGRRRPEGPGPIPGRDAVARLAWLVARLRADGVGRMLAVDLTRPEIGVPVVKVIVPALAGSTYDLALWRRAA